MKRILLSILLAMVLLAGGCGFEGDPMIDDMYTQNVYPGETDTYQVGSEDLRYSEGYFEDLDVGGTLDVTGTSTFNDAISLVDSGKAWIEFRPDLDPTKLSVNAKPTMVQRGYFIGYSLPVGGADEELLFNICVPSRWDGESDIYMHIHAWLDTAQDNALDAVKLELNWNNVSVDGVVPAGGNMIQDEIVVGVVPQFTVIEFHFLIDYDIVPDSPIESDDIITLQLLRAAAGGPEIDGEPVIMHAGVIFLCDKLGNPTVE